MLCIYFISLTACTYLVIIAFCPPTSHHISGDDEHDNEEHQEDHQDIMPRVTATAPAASAAAAAAKKPTAGAKTSGETKADYPPSSVRTVLRIYGLGTEDKYTITKVSEGNADFYIIGFIIDGVLPEEGGYQPSRRTASHSRGAVPSTPSSSISSIYSPSWAKTTPSLTPECRRSTSK